MSVDILALGRVVYPYRLSSCSLHSVLKSCTGERKKEAQVEIASVFVKFPRVLCHILHINSLKYGKRYIPIGLSTIAGARVHTLCQHPHQDAHTI